MFAIKIAGHHTYFLPFLGFRPSFLGLSTLPIDFQDRLKIQHFPEAGQFVRAAVTFISCSEVVKLRNSFQSSIITLK